MSKITKKQLKKELESLLEKVEEFNENCQAHSENDYWSGELYDALCKLLGQK